MVIQKEQLYQKDKVNFKIYDLKTWLTSNSHIHIASYTRSKGNQTMKFGQLIQYNKKNIFL